MDPEPPDLERMAALLEASDDYRVLRRLRARDVYHAPDGQETKIGVVLDTETTGLNDSEDKIIELGMVAFEFAPSTGRVYRVLRRFDAFQDPGFPIPPEITTLTGITDAMVAGAAIDPALVTAFVADAAVVIAHKADFDRRFAERAWPVFETKAWACSLTEVDWMAEGFDGTRLAYLLSGCGWFHVGHRADEDCLALLEILAAPLPKTGETGLKRLLDTARKPTVRVWAIDALYDLKDVLKVRGYRWNDGSDGRPRAWWRDVPAAAAEDEIRFLKTEIYQHQNAEPVSQRITAFVRHSVRT
jgi:DNA polymerase-3 subunit epsilon